jgi:hypothetical protein
MPNCLGEDQRVVGDSVQGNGQVIAMAVSVVLTGPRHLTAWKQPDLSRLRSSW